MQFSCDSWELYNFQNAFSYLTWLSQKLSESRWARITVSTLQKRKWPGRMKERTSPRSVNWWMDVEIELKFWSPEARAEEVPTSFALNWKVGPHALLGIARAFSPPSFSSSLPVLSSFPWRTAGVVGQLLTGDSPAGQGPVPVFHWAAAEYIWYKLFWNLTKHLGDF